MTSNIHYRGQSHSWRKLTAIFVSISFTFSNTFAYGSQISEKPAKPFLTIPADFGRVDESFGGEGDKVIIYLQDAHDSLEAQENIAKIVGHLVENHGVKTVFEEGYEGTIPSDEFFGFIKEKDVKEKVSFFLLDKLRLGGAEYAHINREKEFKLIGADNIRRHLETISWYRETAKQKEEIQDDLNALAKEIEKLANKYFPKELKSWIKLQKKFHENKLSLLDYLKRTLPSLQKAPSLRGSVTGKAEAISEIASLTTFARNDRAEYPNIELLLQAETSKDEALLEKVKEIEPKTLLQEIDRLEINFSKRHLSEARDQKIFQYSKAIAVLKKLNEIEVTPTEYEVSKAVLHNFKTQEFAEFLAKELKKSVVLSKHWETGIEKAVRFYESSESREEAVASQLDAFLKSKKEKVALLVYGGFHKEGIKTLLKERKLSYVVVSPRITEIDVKHRDYYKQLMSVGHHAFEVPLNLSVAARPPTLYEAALNPVNEGPAAAFKPKALIKIVADLVRENPGLSVDLLDRKLAERLSAAPFGGRSEARTWADETEAKIRDWKEKLESLTAFERGILQKSKTKALDPGERTQLERQTAAIEGEVKQWESQLSKALTESRDPSLTVKLTETMRSLAAFRATISARSEARGEPKSNPSFLELKKVMIEGRLAVPAFNHKQAILPPLRLDPKSTQALVEGLGIQLPVAVATLVYFQQGYQGKGESPLPPVEFIQIPVFLLLTGPEKRYVFWTEKLLKSSQPAQLGFYEEYKRSLLQEYLIGEDVDQWKRVGQNIETQELGQILHIGNMETRIPVLIDPRLIPHRKPEQFNREIDLTLENQGSFRSEARQTGSEGATRREALKAVAGALGLAGLAGCAVLVPQPDQIDLIVQSKFEESRSNGLTFKYVEVNGRKALQLEASQGWMQTGISQGIDLKKYSQLEIEYLSEGDSSVKFELKNLDPKLNDTSDHGIATNQRLISDQELLENLHKVKLNFKDTHGKVETLRIDLSKKLVTKDEEGNRIRDYVARIIAFSDPEGKPILRIRLLPARSESRLSKVWKEWRQKGGIFGVILDVALFGSFIFAIYAIYIFIDIQLMLAKIENEVKSPVQYQTQKTAHSEATALRPVVKTRESPPALQTPYALIGHYKSDADGTEFLLVPPEKGVAILRPKYATDIESQPIMKVTYQRGGKVWLELRSTVEEPILKQGLLLDLPPTQGKTKTVEMDLSGELFLYAEPYRQAGMGEIVLFNASDIEGASIRISSIEFFAKAVPSDAKPTASSNLFYRIKTVGTRTGRKNQQLVLYRKTDKGIVRELIGSVSEVDGEILDNVFVSPDGKIVVYKKKVFATSSVIVHRLEDEDWKEIIKEFQTSGNIKAVRFNGNVVEIETEGASKPLRADLSLDLEPKIEPVFWIAGLGRSISLRAATHNASPQDNAGEISRQAGQLTLEELTTFLKKNKGPFVSRKIPEAKRWEYSDENPYLWFWMFAISDSLDRVKKDSTMKDKVEAALREVTERKDVDDWIKSVAERAIKQLRSEVRIYFDSEGGKGGEQEAQEGKRNIGRRLILGLGFGLAGLASFIILAPQFMAKLEEGTTGELAEGEAISRQFKTILQYVRENKIKNITYANLTRAALTLYENGGRAQFEGIAPSGEIKMAVPASRGYSNAVGLQDSPYSTLIALLWFRGKLGRSFYRDLERSPSEDPLLRHFQSPEAFLEFLSEPSRATPELLEGVRIDNFMVLLHDSAAAARAIDEANRKLSQHKLKNAKGWIEALELFKMGHVLGSKTSYGDPEVDFHVIGPQLQMRGSEEPLRFLDGLISELKAGTREPGQVVPAIENYLKRRGYTFRSEAHQDPTDPGTPQSLKRLASRAEVRIAFPDEGKEPDSERRQSRFGWLSLIVAGALIVAAPFVIHQAWQKFKTPQTEISENRPPALTEKEIPEQFKAISSDIRQHRINKISYLGIFYAARSILSGARFKGFDSEGRIQTEETISLPSFASQKNPSPYPVLLEVLAFRSYIPYESELPVRSREQDPLLKNFKSPEELLEFLSNPSRVTPEFAEQVHIDAFMMLMQVHLRLIESIEERVGELKAKPKFKTTQEWVSTLTDLVQGKNFGDVIIRVPGGSNVPDPNREIEFYSVGHGLTMRGNEEPVRFLKSLISEIETGRINPATEEGRVEIKSRTRNYLKSKGYTFRSEARSAKFVTAVSLLFFALAGVIGCVHTSRPVEQTWGANAGGHVPPITHKVTYYEPTQRFFLFEWFRLIFGPEYRYEAQERESREMKEKDEKFQRWKNEGALIEVEWEEWTEDNTEILRVRKTKGNVVDPPEGQGQDSLHRWISPSSSEAPIPIYKWRIRSAEPARSEAREQSEGPGPVTPASTTKINRRSEVHSAPIGPSTPQYRRSDGGNSASAEVRQREARLAIDESLKVFFIRYPTISYEKADALYKRTGTSLVTTALESGGRTERYILRKLEDHLAYSLDLGAQAAIGTALLEIAEKHPSLLSKSPQKPLVVRVLREVLLMLATSKSQHYVEQMKEALKSGNATNATYNGVSALGAIVASRKSPYAERALNLIDDIIRRGRKLDEQSFINVNAQRWTGWIAAREFLEKQTGHYRYLERLREKSRSEMHQDPTDPGTPQSLKRLASRAEVRGKEKPAELQFQIGEKVQRLRGNWSELELDYSAAETSSNYDKLLRYFHLTDERNFVTNPKFVLFAKKGEEPRVVGLSFTRLGILALQVISFDDQINFQAYTNIKLDPKTGQILLGLGNVPRYKFQESPHVVPFSAKAEWDKDSFSITLQVSDNGFKAYLKLLDKRAAAQARVEKIDAELGDSRSEARITEGETRREFGARVRDIFLGLGFGGVLGALGCSRKKDDDAAPALPVVQTVSPSATGTATPLPYRTMQTSGDKRVTPGVLQDDGNTGTKIFRDLSTISTFGEAGIEASVDVTGSRPITFSGVSLIADNSETQGTEETIDLSALTNLTFALWGKSAAFADRGYIEIKDNSGAIARYEVTGIVSTVGYYTLDLTVAGIDLTQIATISFIQNPQIAGANPTGTYTIVFGNVNTKLLPVAEIASTPLNPTAPLQGVSVLPPNTSGAKPTVGEFTSPGTTTVVRRDLSTQALFGFKNTGVQWSSTLPGNQLGHSGMTINYAPGGNVPPGQITLAVQGISPAFSDKLYVDIEDWSGESVRYTLKDITNQLKLHTIDLTGILPINVPQFKQIRVSIDSGLARENYTNAYSIFMGGMDTNFLLIGDLVGQATGQVTSLPLNSAGVQLKMDALAPAGNSSVVTPDDSTLPQFGWQGRRWDFTLALIQDWVAAWTHSDDFATPAIVETSDITKDANGNPITEAKFVLQSTTHNATIVDLVDQNGDHARYQAVGMVVDPTKPYFTVPYTDLPIDLTQFKEITFVQDRTTTPVNTPGTIMLVLGNLRSEMRNVADRLVKARMREIEDELARAGGALEAVNAAEKGTSSGAYSLESAEALRREAEAKQKRLNAELRRLSQRLPGTMTRLIRNRIQAVEGALKQTDQTRESLRKAREGKGQTAYSPRFARRLAGQTTAKRKVLKAQLARLRRALPRARAEVRTSEERLVVESIEVTPQYLEKLVDDLKTGSWAEAFAARNVIARLHQTELIALAPTLIELRKDNRLQTRFPTGQILMAIAPALLKDPWVGDELKISLVNAISQFQPRAAEAILNTALTGQNQPEPVQIAAVQALAQIRSTGRSEVRRGDDSTSSELLNQLKQVEKVRGVSPKIQVEARTHIGELERAQGRSGIGRGNYTRPEAAAEQARSFLSRVRRSEIRQVIKEKVVSLNFDVKEEMDRAKHPALFLVSYKDLTQSFSEAQRSELRILASQVANTRIAIYDADPAGEGLALFKGLDNVLITPSSAEGALRLVGSKFMGRTAHLSKEDSAGLRGQFGAHAQKIKFFRYVGGESGLAVAARLLLDSDGNLPGIGRDQDGFFILVGGLLRSLAQDYLARFAVARSA